MLCYDRQTVAYVDHGEVVSGENRYAKTVRRSDCEVLCLKYTGTLLRCPWCRKYHSQLYVMHSSESRSSSSGKVKHYSHTNCRFLSVTEKIKIAEGISTKNSCPKIFKNCLTRKGEWCVRYHFYFEQH